MLTLPNSPFLLSCPLAKGARSAPCKVSLLPTVLSPWTLVTSFLRPRQAQFGGGGGDRFLSYEFCLWVIPQHTVCSHGKKGEKKSPGISGQQCANVLRYNWGDGAEQKVAAAVDLGSISTPCSVPQPHQE